MYPYLVRRELGVDKPSLLRMVEGERRANAVDVALHKRLLAQHKTPVRALDLDLAEGR